MIMLTGTIEEYETTIKVKGGHLVFDRFINQTQAWYRFQPDPAWKRWLASVVAKINRLV